MAFMTLPESAARSEPRLPIIAFNAAKGRLLLIDRVQDQNGDWSTVKNLSNAVQALSFAVDFGRLETGWIHFAGMRMPLFVMAPYGQPCPAQPPSPGVTASGRAVQFKAGFRMPVWGKAIGGVRDFGGNSAALIAGMNALHTEFEAAPQARAGQIPAVCLADMAIVKVGESSNFQPVFAIIAWIDRPPELGPRTVPPPGTQHAPMAPTRIVVAPVAEAWGGDPPGTHMGPSAEAWAAGARMHAATSAPARPAPAEDWGLPTLVNGRPAQVWHDAAIPTF
jgi:hypothetical protein